MILAPWSPRNWVGSTPDRVVGVHLTGVLTLLPKDTAELATLTEAEAARLKDQKQFERWRRWYSVIQATRPQTLAYALTDSPVGQLAWMADVSLFWLTRTAGSSARLFKATARDLAPSLEPSTVPTGVAVFPREPSVPIRSLAERGHNIMHWSEFDRGGHFPAMEVPDLMVGDLRKFFRGRRGEQRH